MDKIETDCIWVILKKVGPTFFKFMASCLDKGRFFFSQNYLVCDLSIILSVKEFHITIFEFYASGYLKSKIT